MCEVSKRLDQLWAQCQLYFPRQGMDRKPASNWSVRCAAHKWWCILNLQSCEVVCKPRQSFHFFTILSCGSKIVDDCLWGSRSKRCTSAFFVPASRPCACELLCILYGQVSMQFHVIAKVPIWKWHFDFGRRFSVFFCLLHLDVCVLHVAGPQAADARPHRGLGAQELSTQTWRSSEALRFWQIFSKAHSWGVLTGWKRHEADKCTVSTWSKDFHMSVHWMTSQILIWMKVEPLDLHGFTSPILCIAQVAAIENPEWVLFPAQCQGLPLCRIVSMKKVANRSKIGDERWASPWRQVGENGYCRM